MPSKRKNQQDEENPAKAPRKRTKLQKDKVKPKRQEDEVKPAAEASAPNRTSEQNHVSRLLEEEATRRECALIVEKYNENRALILKKHHEELTSLLYDFRSSLEATKTESPSMGDVFVTGSNDCSQLGFTSAEEVSRLTLFKELVDKDIVQITCGSLSNFVRDRQGRVFSWGTSDKGALARRTKENTDSDEKRAERVTGFKPSNHGLEIAATSEDESICGVAAGDCHVLFLTRNGNVYVGGSYVIENRSWREEPPPDHPDEDDTETTLYEGAAPHGFREGPRHVFKMPSIVDRIYAGSSMSAARLVDGTLVTWGCDAQGELGRGSPKEICDIVQKAENAAGKDVRLKTMKDNFLIPKPVEFSEPIGKYVVLDVACGKNYMLVVVRLGNDQETRVYGTGLNAYGQLGLGDQNARNVLTLVSWSVLDGRNARLSFGSNILLQDS